MKIQLKVARLVEVLSFELTQGNIHLLKLIFSEEIF